MYKFLVLNKLYMSGDQEMITDIDAQKIPYVILSILSPEWGVDSVKLSTELQYCRDHKTVLFHDVTKSGEVNSLITITEPVTPINETHAKEIIDFALRWKDDVCDFIIHCEAGLSRSPGVALALSEILNGSDSDFESVVQTLYDVNLHNSTVKQKMLDTYQIYYMKN